jgi:hypothetical protein
MVIQAQDRWLAEFFVLTLLRTALKASVIKQGKELLPVQILDYAKSESPEERALLFASLALVCFSTFYWIHGLM